MLGYELRKAHRYYLSGTVCGLSIAPARRTGSFHVRSDYWRTTWVSISELSSYADLIQYLRSQRKELRAIRIEYGPNKTTTMWQVFHQVLPAKVSHIGTFLDAKIIGYVAREKLKSADCFLMATNITTNVSVRCKVKTPMVSIHSPTLRSVTCVDHHIL
jgi:hypothetical protein